MGGASHHLVRPFACAQFKQNEPGAAVIREMRRVALESNRGELLCPIRALIQLSGGQLAGLNDKQKGRSVHGERRPAV